MAAGKGGSTIIIKRGGEPAEAAHHGGAWKVAYADFVTAMMAFFLLMWLLNATTEKQRQGLADYFNPTIMQSQNGGAAGVEGGQASQTDDMRQAEPSAATPRQQDFEQIAREIQNQLSGSGAESMQHMNLLRHVVTRITDEGLVIELADLVDEPLFIGDTAQATAILRELSTIVAQVLGRVRNGIAVSGHVRGFPEMLIESPVWTLSDQRAHGVRDLLTGGGFAAERIQRVTAYADRRNRDSNPMAPANNRVEVILLR